MDKKAMYTYLRSTLADATKEFLHCANDERTREIVRTRLLEIPDIVPSHGWELRVDAGSDPMMVNVYYEPVPCARRCERCVESGAQEKDGYQESLDIYVGVDFAIPGSDKTSVVTPPCPNCRASKGGYFLCDDCARKEGED